MRISNGGPDVSHKSIVLFPFDDNSIPFQRGVKLHLNGKRRSESSRKIVVPLGDEGEHDSVWIAYYGTVVRVGNELWMWYLGQGPDERWHQRVCIAKSTDGYTWEKPDLGLVEYHGTKNNNLVSFGDDFHVAACVVFCEPDDPDPNRRFKMAFESRKLHGQIGVAYSKDGLTWSESPNNPVAGWFEMAGGTKLDGCYYLAGQGGKHAVGLRQIATFASYDFEYWTEATCSGLRRSNVSPKPAVIGGDAGEQIHLGAGLWNRGNVIIGFYGKWNGDLSNDRRMVTIDLGLAVSNDALHYKEPIPDYAIVSAAEDSWGYKRREYLNLNFPALIQGQGFENVGDDTLFWYAPWPEEASDGIRVMGWPRDRLGYFSPYLSGIWTKSDEKNPHVVTAPIDLEGRPAKMTVNVEGINENSAITVEVLDKHFFPIPGYERTACVGPDENGFGVPVRWTSREFIEPGAAGDSGAIRLRVDFNGIRCEDVRLHAVYVESAEL